MQKIAKIRTSQFHIYLSLKPELTLFLGIIVSNATKWLLGKTNMVFGDNGSTIEAQNSFLCPTCILGATYILGAARCICFFEFLSSKLSKSENSY